MDKDAQAKLIKRYIDAYNSFDIEGMLAGLHPEITFSNISGGRETAKTSGITEFQALVRQGAQAFAFRKQSLISLEQEPERAVADIEFEGTYAADSPGGPKKGEVIKLKGRSEFRFRDGLIAGITDMS